MGNIIFYSLCLFILFILGLTLKKIRNNNVNLGLVLLLLYFIISVFSIIIVKFRIMYIPELTLMPFIVLLASYVIIFYPFFSKNNYFDVENTDIIYYKVYDYLILVYILCTLIVIKVYLPNIIEVIINNNWAEKRNMIYLGEVGKIYNNIFERLAINYINYFSIFALLIYFIFLKYDCRKKIRTILLICIFICNIFPSIENASRGMIFDFFILFISMYLFFLNAIPKKIRRNIILFLIVIGSILVVYSVVVTISRFSVTSELDSNSLKALVEYFGQSPLVFNYGVFPITSHTYGVYSFQNLFSFLGMKDTFSQSDINGGWGYGFYTFVGSVFIDYGIMGVIIHALLLNFILIYLFKRKNFKLSTMYLIFIIYQYLLKGAFVIGRSYIVALTVYIIVYIFIMLIEKVGVSNRKKEILNLREVKYKLRVKLMRR